MVPTCMAASSRQRSFNTDKIIAVSDTEDVLKL